MKQSYHTDIAVKYKLGILEKSVAGQIPASTLFNWKNKDFSHYFGYNEYYYDDNIEMIKAYLSRKELLAAAKAVYFVYSAFSSLFFSVKSAFKVLRESKKTVIDIIDRITSLVGKDRALKAFRISSQQYYAWKNRIMCPVFTFLQCRKIYHNQITDSEIRIVKTYLTDKQYLHWSLISVYLKMLRDKAANMSKTAFYKYARFLNLSRQRPAHRHKKHYTGIRALRLFEILQMDVTIFRPMDNTKIYIYLIIDNFSRHILGWKAALKCNALISLENLKNVCAKYSLYDNSTQVELITDDGQENKGEVNEFVMKQTVNLKKLVAMKDIQFSNSMIEAVNKQLKYDFLFTKDLENYNATVRFLEQAIPEYNHKPHYALHGLTPNEVLNGAIPNKNMFATAIRNAGKQRISDNKEKQDCLNCR